MVCLSGVKVTCHISWWLGTSGSIFIMRAWYLMVSKKKNQLSCQDGIEKSDPYIHVSPEQIFLSQPHTKDVFLLLDFSLTVKAASLIFISECDLAISSAKEGKSGFIYNLVKS